MRLTKHAHACVRIEHSGGSLVLDPGSFCEPTAIEGATAVLITHEHADHYSAELLRRTDAPVYTIAAVAGKIREEAPDVAERVDVVSPGEALTVDGLAVTAVGEKHAVLHPEWPVPDNSGYLVEVDGTSIYHPGDALTAPGRPVDVLLAPASAPWARTYELVEFARQVEAPITIAIHDRIYSAAGAGVLDTQMGAFLPQAGLEWKRLADGEDL
jgi:L-ascorbate metabolism protein UlaG (beta-lactamase superfamily)